LPGAHTAPETLKVICKAFDDAWASIAHNLESRSCPHYDQAGASSEALRCSADADGGSARGRSFIPARALPARLEGKLEDAPPTIIDDDRSAARRMSAQALSGRNRSPSSRRFVYRFLNIGQFDTLGVTYYPLTASDMEEVAGHLIVNDGETYLIRLRQSNLVQMRTFMSCSLSSGCSGLNKR
jgi:hypothetical protein